MTPTDVRPESPAPPAIAEGALVPEGGPRPRRSGLRLTVGTATLLAGVVTAAAGGALVALYQRYLRVEAHALVAGQAQPYGQALGAAIAHRVAVLEGFEGFLAVQPGTGRDAQLLDQYTENLRSSTAGVRALELVRNGRIVAIAPREGNEQALGYDLRKHPDPDVRTKLATNEASDAMTVSGPIALVQGGLGLILRRRFRRPAVTGYDIAALVLDLDPLLAEAGLLHPARVRVAIRDSVGRLLYGSPEVGEETPVTVPVRIPNNVWQLQAVPAAGWDAAIRARLSLFTGGVVLSGTLLVLVVYLVASRQAALLEAVDERTRSLRLAVEELHRSAAERERAEEQLRQSQRLESLGRLAGGIAHDFNNLLTVIIGSLSLARMEVAPETELASDLATAELAAERASTLSRKLLIFARRQAVEYQAVDLNAILGDLRPIVTPLLGEQVRLVEELAPGLWPVYADRGQLEQIVTNLAVNARDAMPDGGTLTLRTRNVELSARPGGEEGLAAGPYVRFEVEDTGVGMTPEVLQRAFEPFFTTKDLGKGTGLGLATVYGLVRQAGGDIALKSEPGRGCRVLIHLPRARVEQTARVEDRSTALAERGGGETVLLVEDESKVRQVTGKILAESGYRVIAAEDGDSALRRLEPDQRIDLLVADVVTPGMGGRALAERILARDPTSRVLFISGYTSDARLEDLLARPGVAFLAKPFTAPQFQRAVRQLLDTPSVG